MRLICGHCANYHHQPFHEDRCLRNGKIVGFLWERDCYTPKLNPNAESEQKPIIIEQDQSEMEQNTNITTKVCKECGRELPVEMFGKHFRTKDGFQPLCRDCRSAKVKGKTQKREVEEETRVVIDGEKVSKELDAIASRVQRSISSALDQELVDELRARGWDVKCTRTIEL